jgi:hypothetical protein
MIVHSAPKKPAARPEKKTAAPSAQSSPVTINPLPSVASSYDRPAIESNKRFASGDFDGSVDHRLVGAVQAALRAATGSAHCSNRTARSSSSNSRNARSKGRILAD